MRIAAFLRFVLGTGVAALLAACQGAQLPMGASTASGATPAFSHDKVFHYTGGKQSFKVPRGVTHIEITAYGAKGAPGLLSPSGFSSHGGGAGTVTAKIPVTPGERLAIFVGASGGHGGFNGGGGITGESCTEYCAGFGGGASDVRQGGDTLADRVVVAGGGGGGASDGCFKSSCSTDGGAGGAGGGSQGQSGVSGSGLYNGGGGTGGTQSAGGSGGAGGGGSTCGGSDGSLGAGGAAGPYGHGCGTNGGGGGGGYYGGGGGGAGGPSTDSYTGGAGGGGGGGSSFAEKRATEVKIGNAGQKGDGSIVILW
jgi:hypothetical protein